ncbi:MAG: hypothetical protein JRJ84_19560 [Deltaproteobacteria bacterium]|nr:hypothetical protein [Deltaproteobacteria bacterium]
MMRAVAIWIGIALLAMLAWGTAVALEPPEVYEAFPFDHDRHVKVFRSNNLVCTDCHPVGLRVEIDGVLSPPQKALPRALSACHGCHRRQFPGAPRSAVGTCTLCHSDRSQLRPEDHDLDWLEQHGEVSRARGAMCRECHPTSVCVDCHDVRGAMAKSPHPPGFDSFHGIEARLDPFSCSACHAGQGCAACHSTGAIPW